MATKKQDAIGLAEETLDVTKRRVTTDRVVVKTFTDEVQEIANVSLEHAAVDVTRVPIGRVVDQPPAVRVEGDVTIIPVLEEVAVVQKQLVLKEELHVRRTVTSQEATVPVTLRKQHATIERQNVATPRPQEPTDDGPNL